MSHPPVWELQCRCTTDERRKEEEKKKKKWKRKGKKQEEDKRSNGGLRFLFKESCFLQAVCIKPRENVRGQVKEGVCHEIRKRGPHLNRPMQLGLVRYQASLDPPKAQLDRVEV